MTLKPSRLQPATEGKPRGCSLQRCSFSLAPISKGDLAKSTLGEAFENLVRVLPQGIPYRNGGLGVTRADINRILSDFERCGRDSLIPLLQRVQDEYGYLSRDSVIAVGSHLGLPASKVYGVATFYNQFRFHPQGQYHIQVCRGTACHVKGSAALLLALQTQLEIAPGETTKDGLFSLEVVACVGACSLAPVIVVNGKFHARVDSEKLEAILDEYRKEAAGAEEGIS